MCRGRRLSDYTIYLTAIQLMMQVTRLITSSGAGLKLVDVLEVVLMTLGGGGFGMTCPHV